MYRILTRSVKLRDSFTNGRDLLPGLCSKLSVRSMMEAVKLNQRRTRVYRIEENEKARSTRPDFSYCRHYVLNGDDGSLATSRILLFISRIRPKTIRSLWYWSSGCPRPSVFSCGTHNPDGILSTARIPIHHFNKTSDQVPLVLISTALRWQRA